jgi:hypothetical protein
MSVLGICGTWRV